jgi:hypothetical protein
MGSWGLALAVALLPSSSFVDILRFSKPPLGHRTTAARLVDRARDGEQEPLLAPAQRLGLSPLCGLRTHHLRFPIALLSPHFYASLRPPIGNDAACRLNRLGIRPRTSKQRVAGSNPAGIAS